jgi:putative two-component system hydrogenase maturation factor HypX/HoxX
MPISANYAQKIGMVDKLLESDRYMTNLHEYAKELYDDDFLWDKQEYLLDNKEMIESHKEQELEIMYPEFWDKDSVFHKLRYEFVYKVCAVRTPERFLAFGVQR